MTFYKRELILLHTWSLFPYVFTFPLRSVFSIVAGANKIFVRPFKNPYVRVLRVKSTFTIIERGNCWNGNHIGFFHSSGFPSSRALFRAVIAKKWIVAAIGTNFAHVKIKSNNKLLTIFRYYYFRLDSDTVVWKVNWSFIRLRSRNVRRCGICAEI